MRCVFLCFKIYNNIILIGFYNSDFAKPKIIFVGLASYISKVLVKPRFTKYNKHVVTSVFSSINILFCLFNDMQSKSLISSSADNIKRRWTTVHYLFNYTGWCGQDVIPTWHPNNDALTPWTPPQVRVIWSYGIRR